MKNDNKVQTAGRPKGRPLSFVFFSAAWGRVLGMVLLTCSAMPANAASNPNSNGKANVVAKPNSVVWGSTKNPTPPPIVTVNQVGGGSDSYSGHSKFSPELRPTQDGGSGGMTSGGSQLQDVIVQFRNMPKASALSAMSGRGATVRAKLNVIRAVHMRVSADMLAELEQNPNVLYITPNRPVKMSAAPEQFASAVQADIAASQFAFDGTGVGVAVIDSGVADHGDLHGALTVSPSRVVYSQSFVPGDTTTGDKYGHGTHVAGLIGGSGKNSGNGNGYGGKYAGMAPNVNIINLRVLDQNGSGNDSQVIAAIQQAIALKTVYNIRVINMSLGRPVFESYLLDPVDQAVEAAWRAGIVVVVAAGNSGRSGPAHGFATIGVPANDPAVITVGATMTQGSSTRVDDKIASYSSKGPTCLDHIVKPDLVAPGNRLVSLRVNGSTMDTKYPQYEVGPSNGNSAKYFVLSGTSMATPVVSGAVALMLQQNPALTPDQVKARLMKTAWKGLGQFSWSSDTFGNIYNNEYDLFTYGAGYLDVQAALSNTDLASGVALSPTAVPNADGTVSVVNTDTSAFGGTSVVWGATSVVWGQSVVWGANTFSSTSVVWGATSVVWGATSDSGYSVVWGATSSLATATQALSDGDDGDN
jgi:serine protease AprX